MAARSDLIGFLTARFDEDEAIAKAATPGPWESAAYGHVNEHGRFEWTWELTHAFDPSVHRMNVIKARGADHAADQCCWPPSDADARHIVNHDPARVLREVTAKRRLLERAGSSHCSDYGSKVAAHYPTPGWRGYCDGCAAAESVDRSNDFTLRILAVVYSDHPDYREEWA